MLSTFSANRLSHQPGVYALPDLVETYSGHRRHERPLRFQWQGAWRTVVQVLSRWQAPGGLGFTVLADDGLKYILEYNQDNDFWKVDTSPPERQTLHHF